MVKQICSNWDSAYENSKVFRVYVKLGPFIAAVLVLVLELAYNTIREDTTAVESVASFVAIILLTVAMLLGIALAIIRNSTKV